MWRLSFAEPDIFGLRTAKTILMLDCEKPENNKRAYRRAESMTTSADPRLVDDTSASAGGGRAKWWRRR
jgi:hypothetical protein